MTVTTVVVVVVIVLKMAAVTGLRLLMHA